jgi:hypothetical protein
MLQDNYRNLNQEILNILRDVIDIHQQFQNGSEFATSDDLDSPISQPQALSLEPCASPTSILRTLVNRIRSQEEKLKNIHTNQQFAMPEELPQTTSEAIDMLIAHLEENLNNGNIQHFESLRQSLRQLYSKLALPTVDSPKPDNVIDEEELSNLSQSYLFYKSFGRQSASHLCK